MSDPRTPQLTAADIETGLEDLAITGIRAGETADPIEAAEEGLAWIPPVDPPTRAGPDGEPEFAAGFGTTAEDEPFDADHHAEPVTDRDERTARVVEALRDDARTAGFADDLVVDTDGSRVTVSGSVADLADEEAVLSVIDEVSGVSETVDLLEVAALETGSEAR